MAVEQRRGLKRIEEKAKEEQAAAIAKHAVLTQLEPIIEGYEVPFVHYWKLYGTRGSINFKPAFSECLRKGKAPDRELFANLIDNFAPVPIVLVDDGCIKSFRPASGNWEKAKSVVPIFPVTVRLENYHGSEAVFEWVSPLASGELWEFQIQFPLYKTTLGRLEIRYEQGIRAMSRGGGEYDKLTIERCDFYPDHHAQRIRWATGDYTRTVPNNFAVYWDNGDEPDDVTSLVKEG